MSDLRSYPKVYNLGHRAIRDLFDGPVVVQEKIDGSQFSFGVIDGVLRVRSKGREIPLPSTDKLFAGAIATAERLKDQLIPGWIYRGEAMRAPKHNTLEYERAPEGNFVLFDIDRGLEDRVGGPDELTVVAEILGLEVVPEFYRGEVADLDHLKELLEKGSMLGGPIEGIVVKNYNRFGQDGKMLMGKWVREAFKEQHRANWKPSTKKDVVQQIVETYRHERRWEKAVERRRDNGELAGEPRDIGPLIQSVQRDVAEECADEIKEKLWEAYRKQIERGVTAGFAEWYKGRLAELQFAEK